jgi:hypothetical protein
MKHIARFILIPSLIFLLSGTSVFAKELRVVGSWNSLTMYKNFEKPFWTEKLPAAMPGIKVEMTSLGEVNLKGPAVLRQMDMGVFDVVHTVADYVVADSPALAGLDMPASGWTTSEFVTALGATGVTMSFSEVPQSLQRGVVDCAITGSLSGYSAGWGEVANYIYPLPVGGWDYVITAMSMKTWDSFSSKEQEQIQTLIKDQLETPAWAVTARETDEGVACLTGGTCPHGAPNKLSLVPVTGKDLERAQRILVDSVLPAWASKVDPSEVAKWNATAGKQANIQAK